MIAPRRDVALAPLTTFRVPATARCLFELSDPAAIDATLAAVAEASRAAAAHDRPSRPFVLGGGSNVLFARDLAEPVLRVALAGRHPLGDDGDAVVVEVGAGETWSDVVDWTLANGWYGLENLTRIPGLAGAAPWQNIGAYGVEVAERIDSVDAVRIADGQRRRFGVDDCAFGYRDSRFKHGEGRDWLIVALRLRLSRRAAPRTGYGEIAAELAAAGMTPSPTAVARAVATIRGRKLPDPAVIGNAGSFFHNPIVERSTADALRDRHPALPAYPVADSPDRVKLSAGWLIEAAGWRGHRRADAGVSDRHALVLVNHGRATGAEILALADAIRTSVAERFGIALTPEPVIVS